MNKVKVIDAICGAGKSTHIFRVMKEHPNEKWLFVSPYLSEVGDGGSQGRIQVTLPEMNFKSPNKSGGKGQHLKKLLSQGENIAITHNLLTSADAECASLAMENGYNLVIDETLDAITSYNGVNKDDFPGLIDNYVLVESVNNASRVGKLVWNYDVFGDKYNGIHSEIKKLCDLESLYLYKNNVLINKLSPAFIRSCKQTYVLTYMFEPSLMCQWFKILDIPYEYSDVDFTGGKSPSEIKQSVRDNLILLDIPRNLKEIQTTSSGNTNYGAFSSTWYKRQHSDVLRGVKVACESTVRNKFPSGSKVFWTTFKPYKDDIIGKGYKRGWDDIETFVSKTKRASNDHAECNCCMYLVNVFPHADVMNFVNNYNIKMDMNEYAISEMVQFIFRGSIRKGESMYLMVASERMMELLKVWLERSE